MFKDTAKEAIRRKYVDRQAAREVARLETCQAEIAEAIGNTVVETRMPIEEGIAFLRAGGEREDAA